jgi:uncharacterized protein (DUF433 family)
MEAFQTGDSFMPVETLEDPTNDQLKEELLQRQSFLYTHFPPMRVDEGGTLRVGQSRIPLDLVIEQYENGMTPEDLVRAYDSLELADVHAVIAYYLRNQGLVQAYVKQREEEAKSLRTKAETEHPPLSRAELLARRHAKEKADAAAGQ